MMGVIFDYDSLDWISMDLWAKFDDGRNFRLRFPRLWIDSG